jgi:hypothetical protein
MKRSTPAPCSCGKARRKPWHLACADCWALVPAPLQAKVFNLYRTARGSGEHIAAIRECHEAIRRYRPLAADFLNAQQP